MYQEQRLAEILELLAEKKQLSAKDMIEHFQVSKDTIRRDFSILSERRLVQRTHGGIIPLDTSRQIPSFNDRINQLNQEKKAIALAQRIKEPMTIYSHSLDNAIMLSSQDKVDFHLLGGKFYPKNRFYYALNEAELLQQISFDIAFIGAASVSDGLVSFEDEADAHLKKLALKHAKTKVLLAEQDKWQKESKYILGPVSNFDYWITDQEPSPEVQELIGDKVKIIY